MGNTEAITMEEGLKRVLNNKKLYHRLLNNFSGRKMVDQAADAINNGDFEEAAKACHALKGLAANLAMHPLTDAASQVEERLKTGEPPEDLMSALRDKLEDVEKAIEAFQVEE